MRIDEPYISVGEAVEIFRKGGMLIVTDDETRENEGDLVAAGELISPEGINFMITEGRGLVCCALTGTRAQQLGLSRLERRGAPEHHTAFLLPVDAAEGVSTGISAYDRAETIHVLSSPYSLPSDLISPGHMFPLEASPGGIRERQGHTEAAVELCRLSGLAEAGVICEIINKDGTMSRRDDLIKFARKHKLKILTIKDLIRSIVE